MHCKICDTLYQVSYHPSLEYDVCATCLQVIKDNVQLYADDLNDKKADKPRDITQVILENAYATLEEIDD